MAEQPVKILDGNTFVVSDSAGDIEASSTDPRGLFAFDTRFLNIWRLTVNGDRLTPLSVDDTQYFEATFFLIPATGTVYSDSELSVGRKRTIDSGFSETVTVTNHVDQPADLTLRIEVGSDFADLFEVKDSLTKTGTYDHRTEPNLLMLGYQRETFRRETCVTTSAPGDVDEHGFTFAVHLEPGGEWTTVLEVKLSAPGPHGDLVQIAWGGRSTESLADNLRRWVDDAPKLDCDDHDLIRTYRQQAAQIASDMFAAARYFDGRLPEAFSGYERAKTRYPVQYPTACSPQAWSTGAPLLFLRTVLGLQPVGDRLVVDPSLPTDLGHLALLDIPGRWGRVDAYGRGKLAVDTTHGVSVGAAAR